MSADVNLGTSLVVHKFTVVYGLIHYTVLLLFRARIMNSTSRPTSRPWDGVKVHAHGDLQGNPLVVTPRELSPRKQPSSRQMDKAMNFKFGTYIHRVHPNKSPLKFWEKMERGRIQGLPQFF